MKPHVVIVGAGVIGLSAAYYALRRGCQVTVIERASQQRDGCSFGNAGMVVPSHFVPLAAPGMVALGLRWMWNPESPFYIKPRLDLDLIHWAYRFWRSSTQDHVRRSAPLLRDLSLSSRRCFIELEEEGLHFGLQRNGLLMLCRTTHGLEEETKAAKKAQEIGLQADVMDPAALAKLEPNVTMTVAGGVWYAQDCHLSPGLYVAALEQEIHRLGGTIRWDAEVTQWDRQGKSLTQAHTTQGLLQADEFVICGGAWSSLCGQTLGLQLPMQAGKGYSLTVEQPQQLPRTCAIFTEARIAVTPMGDTLRFGGTMELAGLDESINQRRVKGITRAVTQYYPAFHEADFAAITPWRGLRPCSPDGLPYLGRTQRFDNLTIATGHAMMGLSLAPVTGQLVAELVTHQTPQIALDALSPDRFG